jgi:hypothetical protein
MSNELAVFSPRTLAEAKDLAAQLATARTLPEALQKSPADILATIMAGAELGLAPMQSIRAIVLIKGKPTLSADAMGALTKSRSDICEYLRLVESTPTKATYETKRKGESQPTTMSFTIEDAQRAGLVAPGGMYIKYPAPMLRARCQSSICRAVYPDLLLGVYDPEELAYGVDVAPSPTHAVTIATVVAPPLASPPPNRAPGDNVEDAALVTPEAHEADAASTIDKCLTWIALAQTPKDLEKILPRITLLPKAEQAAARLPYVARRKELMAAGVAK